MSEGFLKLHSFASLPLPLVPPPSPLLSPPPPLLPSPLPINHSLPCPLTCHISITLASRPLLLSLSLTSFFLLFLKFTHPIISSLIHFFLVTFSPSSLHPFLLSVCVFLFPFFFPTFLYLLPLHTYLSFFINSFFRNLLLLAPGFFFQPIRLVPICPLTFLFILLLPNFSLIPFLLTFSSSSPFLILSTYLHLVSRPPTLLSSSSYFLSGYLFPFSFPPFPTFLYMFSLSPPFSSALTFLSILPLFSFLFSCDLLFRRRVFHFSHSCSLPLIPFISHLSFPASY